MGSKSLFMDMIIRQALIILYLIKLMKLFIYHISKEVYGYATVMWMIIDQGQYYKNAH